MKLMLIFLLMLGCVLLGFVQANTLQKNCVACKDTGNCEDELENCEDGCDNTCRKCMIACVKNQDSANDDEIATKYNSFMESFKCCFQKLTACIRTAKLKKNDFYYDYDTAILTCSVNMMHCTAGSQTKQEYLRKAPLILRGMLREYGQCMKGKVKRSKCVLDYHQNTEELLGRDCLNKYVHCARNYTKPKLDACPSSDALKSCLTDWNNCMKLENCNTGPSFLNPIIKDVWVNCGKSKQAIPSIRCILTNLIKDGKKNLLLDQHIRVGCALAYCSDIKDMKKNYKRCAMSVEGGK